ncbi:MAG: MFS transporter [candidate division WOR-3 bacterium]|nr:MFS transporter [candidate division WOR-3 bacterium]MCX7948197.1 MFS transporter [candidate division WOR-3 bacterium]MDW8151106.1 MFS transporter [candidate division WOR-3 bacterium]
MLFILFLTAFNLFLGFSIIFPIFPEFVEELRGKPIDIGILVSIQPLMQLIFSPIWGKLSDKYGRKSFIFIGMFGYAISFYLTAIANSIEFLFFARVLGGIISSAAIPSILAYASDISNNERRNIALGIVGGGFGLGIVLGPFLGGIIGHIDIRLAFMLSFFIFLGNSILVLILLKEEKLKIVKVKKAKILNGYAIFSSIVYFLIILSATAMQVILGILLNYKFHMDILSIGLIIGIGGLFGAISQLTIGYIIKFFSEKFVIVFSIFLLGIISILMGFINNPNLFYILMPIYGFSFGLSQPNLTARASKKIPNEYQGEFMGIFQAFGSLGRFLGPIVFAYLYGINPSLPYVLSGIILIMVATLTLRWI